MVIATSARAALQANSARPAKATRKGRIFTFGLRALSAAPRLSVPRHTLCLKYGFGSSGLRRPSLTARATQTRRYGRAAVTFSRGLFERLGLREAWIGKVRNGLFLQIVRKAQPFGRIGV